MEKICVAVRVRPPTPESSLGNRSSLWKVDEHRISLYKSLGTPISTASYAFDHVFDERSTNAAVLCLLMDKLVVERRTMTGSERPIRGLLENLSRVSYMEIYNEEINDLLAVENQRLQIHEHLECGVFVAGLKEEIVSDAEQILKLLDFGEVNRHFGETNMNVHSSRSHTIFRMVIERRGKENNSSDVIRVSVLVSDQFHFVRLTEGKYINKSLMILGNVINKLSESAKLRAHIPYRDSKLTRILQPALGGNAKTCIISTIAPEEHHIEESKGTLQFASRAKCITNCAQVNEILTDAALLKCQKLEIEELSMKLQGSHAEVLEQEILKLSNQMLKDFISLRKTPDVLCNVIDSSDFPGSPCFKSTEPSFVVARSSYLGLSDFSPMVHSFGDMADKDTWTKLNKGFVADLDKIQFTPAVRSQPTPLTTPTMVKFNYQVVRNTKLMEEVSELKQETLHMKETPKRLYESVANCKDVYKGVIVTMKSLMAEKESPTARLLFGAAEITTNLISTLESQFSMIMDGQKAGSIVDHPLSGQWETLRVSLKNATTSLVSNAQAKDEFLNSHNKGQEIAAVEEKLKSEVSLIKERYNEAEKELSLDKQLLEASRERGWKRKYSFLKEKRDLAISQSTQRLTASDKENALKDLNVEVKRRKEMVEDIKQISFTLATRQTSLMTLHNEIKSKMRKLTTQNPKYQ
ncbi:hypothetical protein DY000_02041121 [Brassica cretica]|uniref:Kinesin motor domain-containing protein n=1 Tax=Brassica cretica TaxID=69181 RepID=A0ABQ7BDX5_BRACR|nr:hypothetical protein DY000_02041121 [Brassica cretica]